jgi:excisionase family DNA binding protein
MNEQIPAAPDYPAAIFQALLRMEQLLRNLSTRPNYNPKPTLSIDEAARFLGISRSKFKELVRTRQLRSIRVGRRVLIPTESLDAYISKERD